MYLVTRFKTSSISSIPVHLVTPSLRPNQFVLGLSVDTVRKGWLHLPAPASLTARITMLYCVPGDRPVRVYWVVSSPPGTSIGTVDLSGR